MTDQRRVPASPFGQIVAEAAKDEIDLLAVLRTLWRGKALIALAAFIAIALGATYVWALATPRYTALAVVALEDREGAVVDMEAVIGGLSSDKATLNTEIAVMRSRRLVGHLVDELGLTQDPEFNAALRPVEPWSLAWALRSLFGPAPEPTRQEMFDATVDAVLDAVAIANMRDSYVFNIVVETTAPEKSATIANTLAEIYIRDQLELKFEATRKATDWLGGQVVGLKAELQQAEEELKDFHASTELTSSEALAVLSLQMKDLRDRLADTRAATRELEDRLAALGDASRLAPERIAALADDPELDRIVERLGNGAATRAAFEQRVDEVLQRTQAELARESRQARVLESSIAEIEQRIDRQSDELVTLQQLEREVQATALIYETFLSRMKEITVQQGLQEPDARILSGAVVRKRPASPRGALVLALCSVLGVFAGSGLLLVRERLQNVFRTAEELEHFTGLPILGQIPCAPTTRRQKLLKHIIDKPTSAFSDAVRNLRTSILMSNAERPPRVIMLTSSVPGEGKTTQALSLAQNLSQMGKKVLLVEADMRRRTFSEYFQVPDNEPGLVSAVAGRPLAELVVRNDHLGMDILLGERSPVNAADFFASQSFARFVATARDAYDVIILDTPPVLAVPDARVIGKHADAIVYVVRWDATGRRDVAAGLRSFQMLDLAIAGLVLGQVDPRGMRRYGYGGGYGTYGRAYYDD